MQNGAFWGVFMGKLNTYKQHIDFMILLDRIYLEIAQNLFFVS